MAFLNSIASWLMKKRIHQIELFMKYPQEVQLETFAKIIKASKDTEWGKRYKYEEIDNYRRFRERVPVQDYETLKPYINRMREGEQNILWPSEIKWFAKSSGTSNDKSKFIPLSTESLEECHFKGGKDMLTIYCTNYPETQLFTGKSLALTGSFRNSGNTFGTIDGDLSAIIVQNLPKLADFARTPGLEIALLDDWEEKMEKLCEATIGENVTSLAGVPSWMLLLMRHILHKTGKNNIGEIWPSLEVFFHGGISFIPYLEQYKSIMPEKLVYLETFNASEGFFGIQDQTQSKDLLLMLDYGIFYEFIPSSEFNKENPETVLINEVVTGMDYALVISTNGGLWRYQLGDTIRFTTLAPYRVQITGRTKNYINTFGEELMIDNAEKALKTACDKTGSVIAEFTAAPVFGSDSRAGKHQWIIEFERPPENLSYFAELLDNALKALNSDYEAKRFNDMIIDSPLITPVPTGTFYNWLKSKNKLGGQFKVPRLANNRQNADEILAFIIS